MRTRLSFIPVGIIVALAVMATCAPTSALASGTSRAGITSAKPTTWAPGCNGEPYDWSQHPSQIGLTCDGVAIIVGLRWRNWDDASAQATGTLNAAVSCTPNCAEAPRRHYAVRVVASDIGYCGTRRVYGDITVHYTESKAHQKPFTQPTLCSTSGQRPTTRPPATHRPPSPTEFYARPPGGFITCIMLGLPPEAVCFGGPQSSDPPENVATLHPDGQVETCSRHQTEVRCFEGNAGENTPTLSAGDVDNLGPFTCKVLASGVECTITATGKGFLITPESSTEVGG
jgi:hypothetical protein